MTKRKFFRSVIMVEVISETPLDPESMDLDALHFEITEGDSSGVVEWTTTNDEIDGAAAAKKLIEQQSDPGFFRLDEHGNDAD